MSKTVIIGGGITGLATAYYLQEYAAGTAEYTLIEGSPLLGGKITSTHENGFLVEGGPDSFLAQKKATLDLCTALGLDDQLIGSNGGQQISTYVLSEHRLHPMPEGMMLMAPTMILPFLRSRLISWPGKLRMGMEIFVPRTTSKADESLASFVRRRLGAEALDKIAAPLMAGIHAADPEKLSLQSTFPVFVEMETTHRSLLLKMMKTKKTQASPASTSKRTSMFMTLRGGLQQLTEAIAARLNPKALRLNCRVLSVTPDANHYRIALSDGTNILADDIVFATPAYITADLLQRTNFQLAEKLRGIRYTSTATVSLGFKRVDVAHPLNGFGFIVPQSEGRKITACSWSSTKFMHRAPDDCILIRVFMGGALAEDIVEMDEAALVRIARRELQEIMGISATPVLAKAYRWHKSNPQYEVGHRALVSEIEQIVATHSGIYLAGAAYHGSGIPDCIQSGMKTALQIVQMQRHTNRAFTDTFSSVSVPS